MYKVYFDIKEHFPTFEEYSDFCRKSDIWLEENVIPKECEYIAGAGIFYWAFYYEEDAMAFKLRWA